MSEVRALAVAPAPLHVIVADDNEVLRLALGRLIRNLGHSVEAVANGREAVDAATRRPPDLAILDIEMPEMGGVEAAGLLRRDRPVGRPMRIVGFSGDGEPGSAYRSAGMDEFLAKPARLADLKRILDALTPA